MNINEIVEDFIGAKTPKQSDLEGSEEVVRLTGLMDLHEDQLSDTSPIVMVRGR
jgi:hypothetical protein